VAMRIPDLTRQTLTWPASRWSATNVASQRCREFRRFLDRLSAVSRTGATHAGGRK
jgi:hypothetical protein